MMSRIRITLQRCVRQRANDLAKYLRRWVARDVSSAQTATDPACMFDLGSSGGSDVEKNKDGMIAEAFTSSHRKSRRR